MIPNKSDIILEPSEEIQIAVLAAVSKLTEEDAYRVLYLQKFNEAYYLNLGDIPRVKMTREPMARLL